MPGLGEWRNALRCSALRLLRSLARKRLASVLISEFFGPSSADGFHMLSPHTGEGRCPSPIWVPACERVKELVSKRKRGAARPPCVVRDAPSALLTMTYVNDNIEKLPHPRPAPGQALKKPQRGCLEGRSVPTQPSFNSLTRSCAGMAGVDEGGFCHRTGTRAVEPVEAGVQIWRSSAFLFSEAIRPSMPVVRRMAANSDRRVASSLIVPAR